MLNIKIIYFSTGYVYEGKKGNYSENDAVKPFNNYGLSKLGGECAVMMYKNSLVLRITMTEIVPQRTNFVKLSHVFLWLSLSINYFCLALNFGFFLLMI